MTTLLLSSRHSQDDQALWRVAIKRGWSTARARGARAPEINDSEIIFYLEALFSPLIAAELGRKLLDPSEDWLVRLPRQFTQRTIEIASLREARRITSRIFAKPPNDKSFTAGVYSSGADLPNDYDENMSVLVAEPVTWEAEYRCFCLDGKVKTLSPYIRDGVLSKQDDFSANATDLKEATEFAEELLSDVIAITPRAIVIDVGTIQGRGWAVVEANGAWGSGIYGCDPSAALDVIRCATIQP